MRIKNLILVFAAIATVVVLAACGSSGQSSGDQGNQAQGNQANQEEPQAPQKNPDKQQAPKQGSEEVDLASLDPATDEMLRLTVPEMKRINNSEIPTGIGTDETLFHDYAEIGRASCRERV